MHFLVSLFLLRPAPSVQAAPLPPSVVCAVLDFPAQMSPCSSNFMMTASPASVDPQTYYVSQNPGFSGAPFWVNLHGTGAMIQLGGNQ